MTAPLARGQTFLSITAVLCRAAAVSPVGTTAGCGLFLGGLDGAHIADSGTDGGLDGVSRADAAHDSRDSGRDSGSEGDSSTDASEADPSAVLFGGHGTLDGGSGYLSDTWTWNGTAWNHLPVSGPPARVYAAMAPLGGSLVLFGGRTDGDGGTVVFSDTWTWDGMTWSDVAVAGPPARYGAAMACLGGKLVLFGGVGHGDGGAVRSRGMA
jgi:hypothetical protein